ncbi:hypothetical protein Hanom_Chr07g00610001 [Helianthus anomalus]
MMWHLMVEVFCEFGRKSILISQYTHKFTMDMGSDLFVSDYWLLKQPDLQIWIIYIIFQNPRHNIHLHSPFISVLIQAYDSSIAISSQSSPSPSSPLRKARDYARKWSSNASELMELELKERESLVLTVLDSNLSKSLSTYLKM